MPRLDPLRELLFQRWAAKNAPGWNESDVFYDTRGLWEQDPNKQFQPGEHGPDTFKLPGHPTFSRESIYSEGPNHGGTWRQYANGSGDEYVPALGLSHPAKHAEGIPGDQLRRAVIELLGPERR